MFASIVKTKYSLTDLIKTISRHRRPTSSSSASSATSDPICESFDERRTNSYFRLYGKYPSQMSSHHIFRATLAGINSSSPPTRPPRGVKKDQIRKFANNKMLPSQASSSDMGSGYFSKNDSDAPESGFSLAGVLSGCVSRSTSMDIESPQPACAKLTVPQNVKPVSLPETDSPDLASSVNMGPFLLASVDHVPVQCKNMEEPRVLNDHQLRLLEPTQCSATLAAASKAIEDSSAPLFPPHPGNHAPRREVNNVHRSLRGYGCSPKSLNYSRHNETLSRPQTQDHHRSFAPHRDDYQERPRSSGYRQEEPASTRYFSSYRHKEQPSIRRPSNNRSVFQERGSTRSSPARRLVSISRPRTSPLLESSVSGPQDPTPLARAPRF